LISVLARARNADRRSVRLTESKQNIFSTTDTHNSRQCKHNLDAHARITKLIKEPLKLDTHMRQQTRVDSFSDTLTNVW